MEKPTTDSAAAPNDAPIAIAVDAADANQGNSPARKRTMLMAGGGAIALVALIVLVVTLSGQSETEVTEPVAVDFTTGISLVTSYRVETTVKSRLAQTTLSVEIVNGLNCTSIHSLSLELPLSARIASLKTMADDECETRGEVKKLKEARETFAEAASEGLSTSYVEERHGSLYSLQVALPRLGTTSVELVMEQVLSQQVGKIPFQLPLRPIEKVDQITLDITLEDSEAIEILNVGSDLAEEAIISTSNTTGSTEYHFELPNAREYDIPTVLRGTYTPQIFPENGVILQSEDCFEHYMLPTNAPSSPKNILFLVDLSGDSLETKAGIKSMVNLLTEKDTVTIQAFYSGRQDEQLKGPASATNEEKADISRWLDQLPGSYGANLHEALIRGLLRFHGETDRLNVMVLVSNSYVYWEDRAKIAKHFYDKNKDGSVKFFALGLPQANMELLRAIAVMNGGPGTSIEVSTAGQMTEFFAAVLGNVLASSVAISYDTEPKISTRTEFGVLSQGTEIAVRGLLQDGVESVGAVTQALTEDGSKSWAVESIQSSGTRDECFQSYAHARITELVEFWDAAKLLGDLVKPAVKLVSPCTPGKLTECIEKEAIALAIEANIVVKGLTGMVTVDHDECLKIDEAAEVCVDGMTSSYAWENYGDVQASRDYSSSTSVHVVLGSAIMYLIGAVLLF